MFNQGRVQIESLELNGKSRQIASFGTSYRDYSSVNFKVKIGQHTYDLKGKSSDKGEPLATGAFGRVFFGTDEKGNKVAVKVATPEGHNKKILENEASLQSEMRDARHVVGALNVGAQNGTPPLLFIVMENVEGVDLFDKMRETSFKGKGQNIKEKLSIIKDVARGLQELHKAGIVHQDLKPENILVGEDKSAKIIDLGLSVKEKTQEKGQCGTPCYMAPEQLMSSKVSSKTDIYTLGLIAHELLSNELITENSSKFQRINGELKVDHNSYIFSKHPLAVVIAQKRADLINDCLKKDPLERPTADEFIKRLSELGVD